MGLESESHLRIGTESATAKVLLESRELIIRGALKRTLALTEIKDPHTINDELLFEHAGLAYAIALPSGQAAKWLKKLTTAPPTLAAKLGIDPGHRALVWGHSEDTELAHALHNATTTDPRQAALTIAITHTPQHLAAALAEHSQRLPDTHLWVIYPKGAKSTLPEATLRAHMKATDYVDSKSCAVSAALTATRFSRRKP